MPWVDRRGMAWTLLLGRRRQRLDEANYKDIVRAFDDRFLSQKVRAKALEAVRFKGIEDDDHWMVFEVKSSKHWQNGTRYENHVRFSEWDENVDDADYSPVERARLLMFSGNIEINCECPSFLYHGFRYQNTQLGTSLFPEERFPKVRNPRLKGIVCKHMRRVLEALPFYVGDLAKHIKKYHDVKKDKGREWDVGTKVADEVKQGEHDVSYQDVVDGDDEK